MKKTVALLVLICCVIVFRGGEMNNLQGKNIGLKEVSQAEWDKLAEKKIYFGHQSVGYDIMSGIEIIIQRIPNTGLIIKETRKSEDFNAPLFAHSQIGKNKDPISKLNDFKQIMDSGVGNQADLVFFKFCFVDIVEDTDINSVFEHYVKTFKYLEKTYPQTTFIYWSVPLMRKNTSIKANIMRLMGRPVWGDADNNKRNAFNALLLDKYGATNRFFDLAKFEATVKGQAVPKDNDYYLLKRYTHDGGHLNGKGRIRIAEQLLLFLINI